ncbi:hypothetical protein ACHAWF_010693 [Thalassiosira exigua]
MHPLARLLEVRTTKMPRRSPRQTDITHFSASTMAHRPHPHRAESTRANKSANGASSGTQMGQNRRKKSKRRNEAPLFAFDAVKEEITWGRQKRKIKTIPRFDPATKEKHSDCKIGHGFTCPQCSTICSYDASECHQCHLECCYEAGVGVVVLQDRRVSYMPPTPARKRAKGSGESGVKIIDRGEGDFPRGKRKIDASEQNNASRSDIDGDVDNASSNAPGEKLSTVRVGGIGRLSNRSNAPSNGLNETASTDRQADNVSDEKSPSTAIEDSAVNNLNEKSNASVNSMNGATKIEREAGKEAENASKEKTASDKFDGGGGDARRRSYPSANSSKGERKSARRKNIPTGNASYSKEYCQEELARLSTAASKDDAYSTTSSQSLGSGDGSHCSDGAANTAKGPAPKADRSCCQDFKEQLVALQLQYKCIYHDVMKAQDKLSVTTAEIEAAILQRNKDAAAFSETIASSMSKISETKERVAYLTAERDEFRRKVEAKGLPSLSKITPNYSTRIDALQTATTEIRDAYDAARERVEDLMSGNAVAKQENEHAAKDMEEMEKKHGQTFMQCYKEIESLKRQLSGATAKISSLASEKAELVGKVASALVYASRVGRTAEDSSMEVARLKAERDEAVAKTKNMEDTVEQLQRQIEILKSTSR